MVRDLGVRSLRQSVLRDCAAALLIAADAAKRLGVHGASAERHAAFALRLEQLASELVRAESGLDQCEEQIIERVKEPRLAELSLEDRASNLRSEPTIQNSRIKRLSEQLEVALRNAAESRAAIAAREAQISNLRDEVRKHEVTLTATTAELERLQHEVATTIQAISDLEFRRLDLTNSRDKAVLRLAEVRAELEGLRNDPRDSIREAVHRAIAELPADAFDRSVGGDHEH
jgi:chromosome segregation ATPase